MTDAENYLQDLLPMLLARAREAKSEAASKAGDADAPFYAGRRAAYYEVLSTVVGQLDAFGMDGSRFGLPAAKSLEAELL